MKTALFLVVTAALFLTSCSPKTFQGSVNYTIDYELPEAMEAQRAMLPTNMLMYIGEGFTRVEQKTMMGDQIVITDTKEKSAVLLMNMMGQKMAITMNSDDTPETEEPKIEYLDETKVVAGYNCKKAIVTTKDEEGEEQSVEVYYTKEIPSEANDKLKGLDGFPLEYGISAQGMLMTMKAKEIKKEKVAKNLSEIPEGYETMTMEEFLKSMGQ